MFLVWLDSSLISPIQGKYDEAAKESSKALELNPAYIKAYFRRAEAYEKLERYDEAISGELASLVMSLFLFNVHLIMELEFLFFVFFLLPFLLISLVL